MIARGVLKHQEWREHLLEKISGLRRTTKASVEYQFTGQWKGSAQVEYLVYYSRYHAKHPEKSRATYVGLFRFEGSLNGQAGSFVVIDKGTFENGEAKSELKILSGSGTGDLSSISGLGHYAATADSSVIELHYQVAAGEASKVA